MKYGKFANIYNVSEIGLCCWQIDWCWGNVTDIEARQLLRAAVDKGIIFFDTSETYGDGRSERFLGEFIRSTSQKIFISTKRGRRVRETNYLKGCKHEPTSTNSLATL